MTKKILSIFLCFLIILFSFPFTVFSADGIEPIDVTTMDLKVYSATGSSSSDITNSVTVSKITSGTYSGMVCYSMPTSLTANYRDVFLTEPFSVNSKHEYHLDFKYAFSHSNSSFVNINLYYFNSSGVLVKSQGIHYETNNSTSIKTISLDFSPDVSGITGGYSCQLEIVLNQERPSSLTGSQKFYISNFIQLFDKDDNTSVLNNINDNINNVNNKVDELDEKVDGLGDTISSGFTALAEKISGFFDNLISSITGLGDRIQNFFVELGNTILDGLKSLFIPSDGYFDTIIDDLKAFFEKKFGVLMLPLTIVTNVVDLYKNMKTGEGLIEWGDIYILDYKIIKSGYFDLGGLMQMFLDDLGHPTGYIYPQLYYLVTDVIIIFMFVNFCRKKYNSITTGVEN